MTACFERFLEEILGEVLNMSMLPCCTTTGIRSYVDSFDQNVVYVHKRC